MVRNYLIMLPKLREKREIFLFSIFLALAFFISSIEIGGRYIIYFTDIQWEINPHYVLINLFNPFNNGNYGNVGFINFFNLPTVLSEFILNVLHIPIFISEILLLSILQFIALLYVYRIIRDFIFYKPSIIGSTYLSALSSIFIVFGFAPQVLYWWDLLPNGFFLLAFGFGMLYYETVFLKNFVKKQFNARSLTILFIFSSLSISVNTPYNISFLWLLFTLPPILLIDSSEKIRIIRLLLGDLIILISVIAANMWYITTTLLQTSSVKSLANSPSTISTNIYIFDTLAGHFNFLSLFSFSTASSEYSFPSTSTTIFQMYSSYAIPLILIIFSVATFIAIIYKNKQFISLLSLYILTIFFELGYAGPFKNFYFFLFKYPTFLLAFRAPITGFIMAQDFLFVVLIVFSTNLIVSAIRNFIKNISREKMSLEISNLCIFINKLSRNNHSGKVLTYLGVIIMIIIPLFMSSSAVYLGEAIPVQPLHARVSIPQYEYETANYIKNRNLNHYALIFPGGFISQNWTHGYDGYNILPELIGNNNVISGETNFVLKIVCNDIESGHTYLTRNFATTLANMNIKYLVIAGNVSYTPYFGFTYSPNYTNILKSLNSTMNMKLVANFGTNYIYENLVNSSFLYIPHTLLPVNKDGYVITRNITSQFYEDSKISFNLSPNNTIIPTYQNGKLVISLNKNELNTTIHNEGHIPFSWDGYGAPSFFNQYPLSINPLINQYIIIHFQTSKYSAFSVNLVATNNTTGNMAYNYFLAMNRSIFGVSGNADNLGNGNSMLSKYGNGIFNSSNGSTLAINLNSLTNEAINKIVFTLFPIAKNGSAFYGPMSQWPLDENLTIYSIDLAYSPYASPVGPDENSTYIPSDTPLNLNVSLTYNYSNTKISMKLSLSSDKYPIPVILAQNNFGGWVVTSSTNVSSFNILTTNYSTEFLIYPMSGAKQIVLIVTYYPITIFYNDLYISLSIYISGLVAITVIGYTQHKLKAKNMVKIQNSE